MHLFLLNQIARIELLSICGSSQMCRLSGDKIWRAVAQVVDFRIHTVMVLYVTLIAESIALCIKPSNISLAMLFVGAHSMCCVFFVLLVHSCYSCFIFF